MAVAASTIVQTLGTTAPAIINWSSLASGANNVYFDVNGKATGKVIFLVTSINSTSVGTTAGYFYFGASSSASSGSSVPYSGTKLGRIKVRVAPPTTLAKEGVTASTAAAGISVSVFGPYESARFKDSDGYINVCKAKGADDAGEVKIAAILLP
jgi:hypothetical protein